MRAYEPGPGELKYIYTVGYLVTRGMAGVGRGQCLRWGGSRCWLGESSHCECAYV
jgi:hypothetical protein